MLRVKHTVMALAAFVAVAWGSRPAEACSCIQPNLPQLYYLSSEVLSINALDTKVIGNFRYYRAQVIQDHKGCYAPGEIIRLQTSLSSASCGTQIPLNTPYLITGDTVGPNAVSISLCGYNTDLASLDAADQEFLDTRYTCCGNSCACGDGSQPFNCFVDPCQFASCASGGTCFSNYCGGCNAEFYLLPNYVPVCQACADDSDCLFGQSCSAQGECVY